MKKRTKEEAIEKDPVVMKSAGCSCSKFFYFYFLRKNGSKMKKRTKEEAIERKSGGVSGCLTVRSFAG